MLRIKWEPKNKLFSLNNRPRVYALATCIWKESNHIQIWPIELKLENIYLITDTRKCYRGKQGLASHESSKEERLPFDPSSIYSWSIHGLLNRWTDIFIFPRPYWGGGLKASDEPEPSWLEPGLELNNFQLGSARLVAFSIQLGNFLIKARKSA